MQLTINGEVREVPDGLSLSGLIQHLALTDGPVAIERNREVVPRRDHASVLLEPGDVVEIVQFVGGGCGPAAALCSSGSVQQRLSAAAAECAVSRGALPGGARSSPVRGSSVVGP